MLLKKICANSTFLIAHALGLVFTTSCGSISNKEKIETPPNVIMFVMDDLNDWVGPLGYEQVITPNLDRLAKSGVTFRNAQAPGVYCAPSRTAILTGMQSSTTGFYENEVFHYDRPDLESLQMVFNDAGYNAYGAGKIFHHRSGYVDLRGWKEYFTRSQEVKDMAYEMNSYHMNDVPLPDRYPYSPYYTETDRGGNSALHLEWGPIVNEKEEEMADAIRTNWMVDVLKQKHDKPFFMALGMYSPHFPNYAPQKYFDMYDRDALVLPEYKEDDLDDLSPAVQKFYTNRSKQQEELIKYGALKDALHGYLASITFADAMLGRLLDALDQSPHLDNTIVVFWSDQGYHHGEKGHWGKHTLWQRTTQVPFIWAGKGIAKNKAVDTPVSLLDIYPTLAELCNLSVKNKLDGISITSSLKDPSSSKERNIFIPHAKRESYVVVNSNWRYIYRYDSNEELYNIKEDPNEWTNLIGDSKYDDIIKELQKSAPSTFAPAATPRNHLDLVIEGDTFHWEKKKNLK
tara:strand:- start:16609 stop:18153 length:1545 start_codon:yes stop_codon:yes gene_type:complete